MSGETKTSISGWTIDTLSAHLDRVISDLDRRLEQRFTSSENAVAKAEKTMNDRLNAMNEFRDALKDQANRMATRIELDQVTSQVEELRRNKSNMDGRLAVITMAISFAVSIGMMLLSRALR